MAGRRSLSALEREVWDGFVRGVARLRRRDHGPARAVPPAPPAAPAAPTPVQPAPAAAQAPAPAHAPARVKPAAPPAIAHVVIGQRSAGMDERRWRALGSGRLRTERSLDLHNHTAAAAHRALQGFLADAVAGDLRCVEIVTGRGTGETGGVIRRELPHWLNAPALRPLVLAAQYSHHANQGAVRLLLRRRSR